MLRGLPQDTTSCKEEEARVRQALISSFFLFASSVAIIRIREDVYYYIIYNLIVFESAFLGKYIKFISLIFCIYIKSVPVIVLTLITFLLRKC